MNIIRCDKCGAESLKPKDWVHRDDPLAIQGDWCPRCVSILLIKGMQTEKDNEE